MTILALITKPEQVCQVIPWATEFASALNSSVTVLCWAHSLLPQYDVSLAACASLVSAANRCLDEMGEGASTATLAILKTVEIRATLHPSASIAAAKIARTDNVQLIVAAAADQRRKFGTSYVTNSLLRHSPCNTVILFGGLYRKYKTNRILVGSTDSVHDSTALFLATQIAKNRDSVISLARIERQFDQVGFNVGHRDLKRLARSAGIPGEEKIECHVLAADNQVAIVKTLEEQDLILVGANRRQVHKIINVTSKPTTAIIKRAPTARPWHKGHRRKYWLSRLSEADYTDLYDGLRFGSRLNADFLTMLSLAAVVASMGLLQNSPAVVIGSMLLAPLMTPMLGCGLALAQANPTLGNRALYAVVIGLLFTLAISTTIGFLTPGKELTAQILARGDPTVLDLVVAAASAAAAAYALARPSLAGSIAGVAIATALVPPLCSVGLSLAYRDYLNAEGALLLFGTNFIAIVLSAAITFRIMGVNWGLSGYHQRTWVLRLGVIMSAIAIAISIPLYFALQHSILQARPMPMSYPLARSVLEALEEYIDQQPNVELLTAGRPSLSLDNTDVQLVLGVPYNLDSSYAQALIDIVRREMEDDTLSVEVHCIKELWRIRDD
jgi:uncharacterized hydrophobic protein (TIGR00271 family)